MNCPKCGAKLKWKKDYWDYSYDKVWLDMSSLSFMCGSKYNFYKESGKYEVVKECESQT